MPIQEEGQSEKVEDRVLIKLTRILSKIYF